LFPHQPFAGWAHHLVFFKFETPDNLHEGDLLERGVRIFSVRTLEIFRTAAAVGTILSTRSGISVFFYFFFVLAIALVRLPVEGIMSFDTIILSILLVIGVPMTRSLLDRRKRRENPEGIVLGNFGFAR